MFPRQYVAPKSSSAVLTIKKMSRQIDTRNAARNAEQERRTRGVSAVRKESFPPPASCPMLPALSCRDTKECCSIGRPNATSRTIGYWWILLLQIVEPLTRSNRGSAHNLSLASQSCPSALPPSSPPHSLSWHFTHSSSSSAGSPRFSSAARGSYPRHGCPHRRDAADLDGGICCCSPQLLVSRRSDAVTRGRPV